MNSTKTASPDVRQSHERSGIGHSGLKTLETIFRHPLAHNLDWNDVVSLFDRIGSVEQRPDGEVALTVSGVRHCFHKPHAKNLATSELIGLRRFLEGAGWTAESSPMLTTIDKDRMPVNLLIVVDHHGAKLYTIFGKSKERSAPEIKPYDPHHFLHHLVHKDQSREQGQRAPERSSYYEEMARALIGSGKIVVVGHGTGKSNAAHHLVEYLGTHHPEIHRRIVRELVADLSGVKVPELLELVLPILD